MQPATVTRPPTANSPSSLLSLPEGVQDVLLFHVATGKGGLRSLLNLRAVSSTTKRWVDRFPNPQMESIFSKAQIQVTMRSSTLKEFLESPPPFAVTTLCLKFDQDYLMYCDPPPEEELWNRFFEFCTPRLKALEVNKFPGKNHPSMYEKYRRYILAMLQFPNLLRFQSDLKFKWERWMIFPSSLYGVNELSLCFDISEGDDQTKTEVVSHLVRNTQLKKFDACARNPTELDCIRKFIDAKKDDEQLSFAIKFRIPEQPADFVIFVEFAESVVATKSEVRLTIEQWLDENCVETVLNILGEGLCHEFLKRIRRIEYWTLSNNDSLRLLRSLPELTEMRLNLKNVSIFCLRKLELPAKLMKLRLENAFPYEPFLPLHFPETLTSLDLSFVNFRVDALLRGTLASLSTSCINLEHLGVVWTCDSEYEENEFEDDEEDEDEDDEEQIETWSEEPETKDHERLFPKLRSLSLYLEMALEAAADVREVLLSGFRVDDLQLEHLYLEFISERNELRLPVLNAETLKRICEGRLRSSIIRLNVCQELATPDGVKQYWRLRKLTAANWKKREEMEGRGEWQRRYPCWT